MIKFIAISGIVWFVFSVVLACAIGNKGLDQSSEASNESEQTNQSATDTDTRITTSGPAGDISVNNETNTTNENVNAPDQSTHYGLPSWATVLLILGSQAVDKAGRRWKHYRRLDDAVKGRNGTASINS